VRTLIVSEFVSLDGVVDSPGGGPHPHAGWTFQDVEFDEAAYELKGREEEEAGALLMGRVSYEEFSPVWKTMDEFERYNAMPKYVVSTTLAESDLDPEWAPTSILRSLDDVAELKEGDGDPIILAGSASLAQGLAAAGLVDRYHLLEFPVVLGSGRRLFVTEGGEKQNLRLVEHATYGNGIRMAVYDVVR
jgi:dihydrofolate reductase